MKLAPAPMLILLTLCGLATAPLDGQAPEVDFQPPRLTSEMRVYLPAQLRHLRMVDAFVECILQVGPEGQVLDQVAVEASHRGLIEVAVRALRRAEVAPGRLGGEPGGAARALRRAEFAPGRLAGEPVAAPLRLRVHFRDPTEAIGVAVMQSGLDHIIANQESLAGRDHGYFTATPAQLDAPLELLRQGALYVPENDAGERLHGGSTLEFYVDREGRPRLPRVVKSGGERIDQAALLSLREMRFAPPTVNRQPTTVKVRLPFRFTAEED